MEFHLIREQLICVIMYNNFLKVGNKWKKIISFMKKKASYHMNNQRQKQYQ